MSGLATRLGSNFLKVKKVLIQHDFRRLSSINTLKDKYGKHVLTYIGVVMVTPVAAYLIYAQTREAEVGFTYFGKGKVIGAPKIEVGLNGMKLEFTTDHNGNTAYLKEDEKYKNDEYEFREKMGNPKVVYHKDTDLSDVKFRLLQKRKPVQ